MRRQLETERKKKQALDMKLNRELASRNELQMFLKQCLVDVREEVSKGSNKWGGKQGNGRKGKARVALRPHSAKSSRRLLGSSDRSRVLELLFAQERVLELLYSQAF